MSPDSENDRNFRDPADYGAGPSSPRPSSAPRAERERLSNDYDDDAPPRRRAAAAPESASRAGGLASLLGSDPATRKLVGGAIGIGAVLLLAVGGWSLTGGHHGGIPIIGPPPGPVKDVPTDPGGMQIMGSDSGDTDLTGNGEAHLAPGPEQPDAKALARQYGVQPGTPPAAQPDKPAAPADATPPDGAAPAAPDVAAGKDKAAAEPSAVPPAAPENKDAASAPADAETPEDAPAPKPVPAIKPQPKAPDAPVHKAVPPKPVQKPLPAPVAEPENAVPQQKTAAATLKAEAGGAREVQLAALDSEAAARKEWDTLRHQAPGLFAGHSPLFEKTAHGDKTFVRLRIGGFADLKAARAYCVKLHAQSIACTPAQF